MGEDIAVVMLAVIREHGEAVLHQFEAVLFGIVDHDFRGSRCIQGRARPMGSAHNVPARA